MRHAIFFDSYYPKQNLLIESNLHFTAVNVYANVQRQPGGIQWEPVTPLPSTNQNVAQQPRDTSSEQYNLPPPGSTGNLDSVL